MKNFIFEYPVKVYFGQGAVGQYLSQAVAPYGKTVMLAYGGGSIQKNGIYEEVKGCLTAAGKDIVEFPWIMPNPTYSKVQEGAALAKSRHVDFILAVGGGSVMDCCKVLAAQACTEDDIWEVEYVNRQVPEHWIPLGAVVTAAGTGSEMNSCGVITHEGKGRKAGLWGIHADFSILDPWYTLSLPMDQLVSGAFDTLSHCMETYFGKPDSITLSDELAEAVMRSTIRNLRAAIRNPQDMEARSELMWASSMGENGILKIGKITDFQAHQIQHQLGAYTDCNHGKGLAVIHPVLYRHIYECALPKFARFAREVWGIAEEGKTEQELALAGIEALASFIREVGLPTTLTQLGITDEKILLDAANSCNLPDGCCKKLQRSEIFEILKECL